jgi:hypothetical protein
MASSYGAGNYGMCGQAYGPRFLFTWPNAKTAVMGPQQLAGVLSIVARQSAASMGRPFDEEADERCARVEEQIERESLALFMTGRLYDDGIIDPRDTRTVLGMCLSAIDNQRGPRHARLRRVPDVMRVIATSSSPTAARSPPHHAARAAGSDRTVAVSQRRRRGRPHVAERTLPCASRAPPARHVPARSTCSSTPLASGADASTRLRLPRRARRFARP